MRRCLLSICLILICAGPLGAEPVDRDDARTVARAHLERRGVADRRLADPVDLVSDGRILARIFPLDPAGYVVVSAETDLPPVIAYSFEADYPGDDGTGGPLADLLVADLSGRLGTIDLVDEEILSRRGDAWRNALTGTLEATRAEQWPPAGTTPTGGWLQENWTQNAPYNGLCPIDRAAGGGRSVAGCPAVAMGMILAHLETTHGTRLDAGDRYRHAYAGNTYWIPDAAEEFGFPDFATLGGHLATLEADWASGRPPSSTGKAALVFACGVAATQVFSAGGSGTFGVDQAFAAYRRFGFDDCRLLVDDPDLYADLAEEMMAGHPAHLAVVDPGWTMGHNLVVDGYDSDGYYHLNFGWGGVYNGWYRLPSEIPYGLTVVEGFVLDIMPGTTGVDEAAPQVLEVSLGLATHPNPFNPSTTISFEAPAPGRARVAVYDLLGRRVAELMDRDVGAERVTLTWSPDGLASGVYMVRVAVGSATESRRVVLAK